MNESGGEAVKLQSRLKKSNKHLWVTHLTPSLVNQPVVVTLVTESLTLMAGIFSSPFFSILYRLWTPVVVSSDTPRIPESHLQNVKSETPEDNRTFLR